MNFQIFENGDGSSDIRKTFFFDGTGTFFEDGEGGDGTSSNACGCTDPAAYNYDDAAEYDDGKMNILYPVAPTLPRVTMTPTQQTTMDLACN